MDDKTNIATPPAEVSVGTPTDTGDPNDELMMTGDGDTGAAVAAREQATKVTPRKDIDSPPRVDTAGTNTSSHGSSASPRGS